MSYLWGSLMLLMGLYIFISAILKSEFIIYRLFHARAKMLWGDNAHSFLMIVGLIIAGLSSMFFLGMWG
jgi:hypothetical protein